MNTTGCGQSWVSARSSSLGEPVAFQCTQRSFLFSSFSETNVKTRQEIHLRTCNFRSCTVHFYAECCWNVQSMHTQLACWQSAPPLLRPFVWNWNCKCTVTRDTHYCCHGTLQETLKPAFLWSWELIFIHSIVSQQTWIQVCQTKLAQCVFFPALSRGKA